MTFDNFESTILHSSPSDWKYTENGIVYKPNISIFVEYELFDGEVTSETRDLEERFNYYQQRSKYRLFYNGNCLYTQWFIVAGSGIYICAIPFIEGYVEDDDYLISVDKLHYHICFLISAHTCGLDKDEYDKIMTNERVSVLEADGNG